jgi:hypothetical protein
MTAIRADGYGVIVLTPDRLLDWSGGEAVLRFDVSTFRSSSRDWIKVWISPFDEQLPVPAGEFVPDLNGPPANGVFVEMTGNGNLCPRVVRAFVVTPLACDDTRDLAERVPASATARATVEVRLSRTRVRVSMPQLVAYSVYFGIPSLRRVRLRRRAWFVSRDMVRRANATIDSLTAGFFSVGRMQRSELTRVSLPHLLRYEDRNSMAWSVEARVPFVTPRFVETALGLPVELKIRDGYTKHALRSAAHETIPDEIAWRRNKFGFEAPTTKWMEAHAPVVESELRRSRILRDLAPAGVNIRSIDSGLVWRLYNLAVWERGFGVTG